MAGLEINIPVMVETVVWVIGKSAKNLGHFEVNLKLNELLSALALHAHMACTEGIPTEQHC